MTGEVSRPGTSRWRAHYVQPFPVEFDATLPDDLEDAEDERLFLLDAAPFTEQRSAVRVERVVPDSAAVAGATNGPKPGPGSSASGNHGSGDLRPPHPLDRARALAALLEPEAFDQSVAQHPDRRRETQDAALRHAIRAVDLDWYRVAEDEATVELVGAAIRDAMSRVRQSVEDFTSPDAAWSEVARAAVRALREAGDA